MRSCACARRRAHHYRYNYTTPKSFLEMVVMYKDLLAQKRREVGEQVKR